LVAGRILPPSIFISDLQVLIPRVLLSGWALLLTASTSAIKWSVFLTKEECNYELNYNSSN